MVSKTSLHKVTVLSVDYFGSYILFCNIRDQNLMLNLCIGMLCSNQNQWKCIHIILNVQFIPLHLQSYNPQNTLWIEEVIYYPVICLSCFYRTKLVYFLFSDTVLIMRSTTVTINIQVGLRIGLLSFPPTCSAKLLLSSHFLLFFHLCSSGSI